MLELVLGTNRKIRREHLFNSLRNECKQNINNLYLLVPDQTTHTIQKEVCIQLGNQASAHIEVIDFDQLVEKVHEERGHNMEYMDEGGHTLAMYSAITSVQNKLTIYKDAATKSEFVTEMVGIRNTLHQNGISRSYLDNIKESSISDSLKSKISDISLIFDSYDTVCESSKLNPANELDIIPSLIAGSKWVADSHWYIDGFSAFTFPQQKIIESLISTSKKVTAYFHCSNIEQNDSCCQISATTALTLQDYCVNNHIKYRKDNLSDPMPKNTALSVLKEELCNSSVATAHEISDAEGSVKIYADPTAREECIHVAGTIMRAVRNGYRYKDISVVLPDYDTYAPIIDTVFTRYNIPTYFSSRKEDLTKKPIMLAIKYALNAAACGMSKDNVINYLKTGISTLSIDEVDELENYVLTWNIHGRDWAPPEGGWIMHPQGYGKEFSDDDEATLSRINSAREKGVQPLLKLKDAFESSILASDYVIALYDFLNETEFFSFIQNAINELIAAGDTQTAHEYSQLANAITHALDQIYSVLGDTTIKTQEFPKFFWLICNQYKIATIPYAMDQVNIYNVSDSQFFSSKIRFVVGARENTFPAHNNKNIIFSDDETDEIQSISGMKNYFSMGSYNVVNRDLSDINIMVALTEESLIFTYPLNGNIVPSYLINRIQTLLPSVKPESGVNELQIYEADLMTPSAVGRLLGKLNQNEKYFDVAMNLSTIANDEMQQIAMDIMERTDWALEDLTKKSIKGLYGERLSLSATSVDTWSSCRYHYFLKYGLALHEPAKNAFNSPAFGTFAHYVLDMAMKEIQNTIGFKAVTKEQISDITKKYIDNYTSTKMKSLDKQPERYTYLYHRNCREVLNIMQNMCEELSKSDFVPQDYEIHFGGKDSTLPAINVHGKTSSAQYTGIADRIDVCNISGTQYYRIMDYKTGKAKTLEMSELLDGLTLQLLIYQVAYKKAHPDSASAGMLYVPAQSDVVSMQEKGNPEKLERKKKKAQTRHGLIIDDKEVLHAMENSTAPEFIPVKYSADGSVTGDVCSAEMMDKLDIFTTAKMEEIVDGIASGNVKSNPISRGMNRTSCSYCPMKNACSHDNCAVKFRYRTHISPDEFWSRISD